MNCKIEKINEIINFREYDFNDIKIFKSISSTFENDLIEFKKYIMEEKNHYEKVLKRQVRMDYVENAMCHLENIDEGLKIINSLI